MESKNIESFEATNKMTRRKRKESVKNRRRRGRRRRRRKRGGVKSSELDKETCGVLVKGTCVSRVRQSTNERLPE